MAHPHSSNSGTTNTTTLGTFETYLAIPIYALAWVIMWLVGVTIEYVIFVFNSLCQGQPLHRKYFELSLAMPVFALFCLALWFSVGCIEYSIIFLCSLANDEDSEETVIRDYEEHVLRRRLQGSKRHY
jgi:hypothetical protein